MNTNKFWRFFDSNKKETRPNGHAHFLKEILLPSHRKPCAKIWKQIDWWQNGVLFYEFHCFAPVQTVHGRRQIREWVFCVLFFVTEDDHDVSPQIQMRRSSFLSPNRWALDQMGISRGCVVSRGQIIVGPRVPSPATGTWTVDRTQSASQSNIRRSRFQSLQFPIAGPNDRWHSISGYWRCGPISESE